VCSRDAAGAPRLPLLFSPTPNLSSVSGGSPIRSSMKALIDSDISESFSAAQSTFSCRSTDSRPMTVDQVVAPIGPRSALSRSITTSVGYSGSNEVGFRLDDAVCTAYSISAVVR
jgi:hypothetical protein